jgi:Na+/melibiose symporter-like transporter
MILLVFGILQSKSWGWINPLGAPSINGKAVTPLGISLVAYLILAGILVLWWFVDRQRKLERIGGYPLLKVSMLRIPALRSGLSVLLGQYFTIAALFFVIPVYLQINLGYDALKTGVKLIPLSIGLLIFSVVGSRLALKKSAKRISRWGQLGLALGTLIVIAGISTQLNSVLFWVGMFVIGLGFGLLASQINNVNMSAVDQSETSEVGGLQGTFQNMGTSLGTAVVGSFFILLMTSGFQSAVQSSTSLSQNQKSFITTQTKDGVQIVSKSAVQTSVMQHGGSAATAQTVADLYDQAQVRALKSALFIVFVVGVLSLLLSKRLPNEAVPVEK